MILALFMFVGVVIFAIHSDRDVRTTMKLPFANFEFETTRPVQRNEGSLEKRDASRNVDGHTNRPSNR